VLALDVSEEELVQRLLKRGETSNRPDDRDEAVIRKRYQVYKNETEVVAEHYKAQDKFEVLKGEGSVDEIFTALRTASNGKWRLSRFPEILCVPSAPIVV
jgi:adenylate kinase